MDNTLTLQIANPSLKEQLIHIFSLMKGVKIVSSDATSKDEVLDDVPNSTTLAAMKEAESGRDAGVVRVGKQNPKKLVIIGVDKVKKVCYGSVLVNTKMSPKAVYSASFLSAQYLLHQSDYPDFLKYDSYVDCGMLFSIPLEKLMDGEYFGTLTDDDLKCIFDILKTTETLTNKEKKRFGIL